MHFIYHEPLETCHRPEQCRGFSASRPLVNVHACFMFSEMRNTGRNQFGINEYRSVKDHLPFAGTQKCQENPRILNVLRQCFNQE